MIIIEDIDSIECALKRLKKELDGDVMVPYLTDEQIEAEGWVACPEKQLFQDVLLFKGPDNIYFAINLDIHSSSFAFDNDRNRLLFNGKVRCINDFRLICKMLGIETTKNKEYEI